MCVTLTIKVYYFNPVIFLLFPKSPAKTKNKYLFAPQLYMLRKLENVSILNKLQRQCEHNG